MRKWILSISAVLLVLSFIILLLMSPTDTQYLAQFDDSHYKTLAAFDVPTEGQRILDISEALPFTWRVEKGDVDQILVQFNTSIPQAKLDYIQSALVGTVYVVPETGVRVNFELRVNKPLIHYTAETFNSILLYSSDYFDLLNGQQKTEVRIVIPQNYTLDQQAR